MIHFQCLDFYNDDPKMYTDVYADSYEEAALKFSIYRNYVPTLIFVKTLGHNLVYQYSPIYTEIMVKTVTNLEYEGKEIEGEIDWS